MKKLLQLAPDFLRYRKLIGLGLLCAVIETLCVGGGFGTLMQVIDQMIIQENTLREVGHGYLSNERLMSWFGDYRHLANYLPENRYQGFAIVMIIVWLFSMVGAAARFSHEYLTVEVVYRVVMVWRAKLFRRLILLQMRVLNERGMIDHVSRVLTDAGWLGRGYKAILGKGIRDGLMGSMFMGIAIYTNWKLTALFLISGPMVVLALWFFGGQIRRAGKRAMEQVATLMSKSVETLQALPVVKAHNAEGYERQRFNVTNRRLFRYELKARLARSLGPPITDSIAITGIILVAMLAAYLVFYDGVPGKELGQVLIALALSGASFKALAKMNNDLQEALAAGERMLEVMDLPIERTRRDDAREGRRKLSRHASTVRFEHVGFIYPGTDQEVLKDVNLTFQFGQKIAVVGPNGSGKSTLLNLLPALYEPTSGRILIDQTELQHAELRSIRDQIAIVNQQTVLFEDTIARNIRFGNRNATLPQIKQACKIAHADEFIERMDKGYDSKLSEGGTGLSGGQRQRLAIARAILRDPAILILDEATSQVDSESEARINEAMRAITQGRTTFIIAHRLSTVVDADIIVVMNDGRVEATGTHEELMNSSVTYQSLVKTQFHVADV